MIVCDICGLPIVFCRCKDIDERLKEVYGDKHIVFYVCLLCLRHHVRCRCPIPLWTISNDIKVINKHN
jgi:hypothetical protein